MVFVGAIDGFSGFTYWFGELRGMIVCIDGLIGGVYIDGCWWSLH